MDGEAEVTLRDHRFPVSTRVERVGTDTVVVRSSLGFLDLTGKQQDRVRRRVFRAMREERARGSQWPCP